MLGAATVMLSLGVNVYVLVVSRLFQGFSAAIVYTGGLALLMDTVGLDEIGKWMSFVLSFANAGILVSPSLGGLIYGKLGSNAVFAAMGVVVALDIILRVVMVERKGGSRSTSPTGDEEGLPADRVNASEYDPLLVDPAVLQTQPPGQNDVSKIKRKMPTLLILLAKPRILAIMYGVMLAQTVLTSFDGALSIFVQQTFGWGSTRAGLLFLTITIPTLTAPLAGMLSDRFGPRWVAAAGFMLATVMLALLPLVSFNSFSQVLLLCVLLTMIGT